MSLLFSSLPSLLSLALATALAALAGRALRQRRERTRAARRRVGQMPEALERMAAALRTGSSLPQALAEAGHSIAPPLGPELAELARRTGTGQPVRAVLDDWGAACPDSATRLASTALVLATRVGAAPARALDGVAATLRDRLGLTEERRAQAAQARYSAAVLSIAPLGFTGALMATNGAAARFLLGTPLGWGCLLLGLGLDAAGAAWMGHLTRANQP